MFSFTFIAVVGFKTKDTLKEEDVELTSQISDLQRRYSNIYKVVDNLSETYMSCRDHVALLRYGDLKDMIKGIVNEFL